MPPPTTMHNHPRPANIYPPPSTTTRPPTAKIYPSKAFYKKNIKIFYSEICYEKHFD